MTSAHLVHSLSHAVQDARRLPIRVHPVVVIRIYALPLRLGQGHDLIGAEMLVWGQGGDLIMFVADLVGAPQIGGIDRYKCLVLRCQEDGRRGLHGEIQRMMNHRL